MTPALSAVAPRTFSFIGLGSATSGRFARDTDELRADGLRPRADLGPGGTDASPVVVAERLNVTRIATLDRR